MHIDRWSPARRRMMVPSLGLAMAVLLAACGGGGGGGSADDRAAIEDLLVTHYADPTCADLTDAGRAAFGHPVADQACEQDLAGFEPRDVTVSDVEVDGDEATAMVGNFTFQLVRQDGVWLIDG